jgi:hypothetical protein
MQHAEAHERLADLALEPGALAALDRDPSPVSVELRAHIAGCAICTTELEAWRRTQATVRETFSGSITGPASATIDDQPIALPPELRAAVARIPALERARAASPGGAGTPTLLSSRRTFRGRAWFGLAAALVVALAGSGALALNQVHQLDTARAESAELGKLIHTTELILAEPANKSVALTSADGTSAGIVAWSKSDAIVIAANLTEPPPGLIYRCWVEKDGTRSPVGDMAFHQGLGYWWQHPYETSGPTLWGGGTLVVALGPPDGPGGPALLSAPLPG